MLFELCTANSMLIGGCCVRESAIHGPAASHRINIRCQVCGLPCRVLMQRLGPSDAVILLTLNRKGNRWRTRIISIFIFNLFLYNSVSLYLNLLYLSISIGRYIYWFDLRDLTLVSLHVVLDQPLQTRRVSLLNNGLRVASHHQRTTPG